MYYLHLAPTTNLDDKTSAMLSQSRHKIPRATYVGLGLGLELDVKVRVSSQPYFAHSVEDGARFLT